ncbi:HPP family protein [Amphritea pacifica]|uniref:CBS domain-containing protein n=1 Tax=Amphritea pacifica TaxID=2811233 RepID=UPI001965E156|nr:CBS domain-containing protein [Amphritea pacifica]MBN1007179.1 CBS domain-containing protein [Amphritea pacifica]
MFSVYSPNGRAFHDTLEALYRARSGTQNRSTDEHKRQSETAHRVTPKALDAYRQLIHAQPKDELHHLYEVMSDAFTNLPAEQPAYQALLAIQQSPFNELPVVNAQNCIIGMISYDSVIGHLIETGEALGLLKISAVRDYLSGDVITAEPVTSIRRAAQVMDHYNLETLPVVDNYGTTIGIVTARSIVSAVANDPPLSVWS